MVAIITYVTIIFGELVPKRIGQIYPADRAGSRPMLLAVRAAGPFVKLLSASTQAILKLLAIDTSTRLLTEERSRTAWKKAWRRGVIEAEHQMVRNVFHLDDRLLTSMMVPRSDLVARSSTACARRSGAPARARCTLVSRVPRLAGRGGRRDQRVAPDLAGSAARRPGGAALPAAPFVPETLSGMELLEQFRIQAARLVFVVDEYGVVQGLLTPHDLLEAITGELQPAEQAEARPQREDGSWLLDGLMPVSELKARLEIRELPQEDKGRYNTLAGLLMAVTGHLPQPGERIDCGEWVFEVVDLDGRRIDKVLAQTVPEPADAAAGD